MARLVLICVVILFAVPAFDALACYESVGGRNMIMEDPAWKYCAIVPAWIGDERNGSRFGTGPGIDHMLFIDVAFSVNSPSYRLLSYCYYEMYKFAAPMMGADAEFMLRCVCNYDLCNSETDISKYFTSLRQESMIRESKK
ncbi:hypothetical protein DdX_17108 [Ditylenchus destructor]|uniref:Uncharacterized protein n=1 Tax=Ditylenchus destructor TaxID=166010 RepID=A0AAD4MNF0_9BILA|nr:hypothetical protein DdX_17108 [Ditylenchus destructor]